MNRDAAARRTRSAVPVGQDAGEGLAQSQGDLSTEMASAKSETAIPSSLEPVPGTAEISAGCPWPGVILGGAPQRASAWAARRPRQRERFDMGW